MSGTSYNQGTAVTLDAFFTVDGAAADPTSITFRIRQPDDTIVEYVYGADSEVTRIGVGSYECNLPAPSEPGQYHYDAVGTGTVQATLPGEFFVIPSSVTATGNPTGPQAGPAASWVAGEDIADFLGETPSSSDIGLFDTAAAAASQLLFELSGRQYLGINQQSARPCVQPCNAWGLLAGYPSQWWGFGWNGLDWGPGGAGWGWWGQDGSALCGCRPLSQIKLAGYPVTAIVQVKIDGAVLPAADDNGNPNYRLDEWQLLTRMADPGPPVQPRFWPGCQNLDLDDTQSGTFSVTYTFGVAPPLPGVLAAQELGCEIYKFLTNQDCALPVGASRLTRQGVDITRGLLVTWGLQQHARGGQNPRTYSTGLALVDAFLSAYNPTGRRSRPRVFSPDLQQYARHVGP